MTQGKRIYEYMMTHGSITSAEAFEHCGCTRLSARIFDLKRKGVMIDKDTITRVNRYGEKVRFDRYRVVK